MDIDRSRGFGIVTENAKWVTEADKLLQADSKRTGYTCDQDTFVVSPVNARKVLGKFLSKAQKQLLIYDPKISDRAMIRVLKDRGKAGVEIRVIGQTKAGLEARMLSNLRLHTRSIIRDAEEAFIGSQSLRATELDLRREAGLIVSDAPIVGKLIETFELDWSSGVAEKSRAVLLDLDKEKSPNQDAEIAMKVLVEELHPVTSVVKKAVENIVAQAGEEILQDGKVKETVKKVVKKVVKQAVKEAIQS
jgi:phosphatidylserine/phosphatidylglycerophosphate/cardiolipin synthase-like enzyme